MLRGGNRTLSGADVEDIEDGHPPYPSKSASSLIRFITDGPFVLVAFLVLLFLGVQCFFTHVVQPEGGSLGTTPPGVKLGWVRPVSSRYMANSTFSQPPGVRPSPSSLLSLQVLEGP